MKTITISAVLACLLLPASAAAQAPAAVAVSTPAPTVDQVYRPANMRDPLKVSVVFGDEHAPNARASSAGLETSTFSVYNLSLTGIMEDSRSKEAMLLDNVTGATYILKGGRLLDARKKQISGVSGLVKGKQVILMTEDKKVQQLNLHEKDQ